MKMSSQLTESHISPLIYTQICETQFSIAFYWGIPLERGSISKADDQRFRVSYRRDGEWRTTLPLFLLLPDPRPQTPHPSSSPHLTSGLYQGRVHDPGRRTKDGSSAFHALLGGRRTSLYDLPTSYLSPLSPQVFAIHHRHSPLSVSSRSISDTYVASFCYIIIA